MVPSWKLCQECEDKRNRIYYEKKLKEGRIKRKVEREKRGVDYRKLNTTWRSVYKELGQTQNDYC